jgi:molecular chaperone GrpE
MTEEDSGQDPVGGDTDGEPATGDEPADEGLVARVAAHDEELAGEVADLIERAEHHEAEREELATRAAEHEEEVAELTERLQRTKADFQNYKKRAERRREEVKERATEDLIERLLDVRDNLQRALDQDADADIRDGVEATLRSFDDVLDAEDVAQIAPEPGEDLDPERHEALQRVAADQPAGTVVDVYRPGYEMDDTVLRSAQVTVSEE